MTSHQYRVVWKRTDCPRKTKVYATLRGAQQFMIILGPEPWLSVISPRHDPNELYCCGGTSAEQCACGGITVREHWLQGREEMPPLEYVRLERRPVGQWETPEAPPA